MKKRNFKIICLMLAIMMAFSMTSMVWAVDEVVEVENELIIGEDNELMSSYCLSWHLTSLCSRGWY